MSGGAKRNGAAIIAAALSSFLVTACEVGPDYQRPAAPVPASYKEIEGWKPAQPADEAIRGAWWSPYGDPQLDGLEQRIDISNQTLKASEAAFRQARALVEESRAGLFPSIDLNGSAQRSGSGGRRGGTKTASSSSGSGSTLYDASLGASWVPDLWGRIRRTVESDRAFAQASEADLAAARLSSQTELATDYIQLRINDDLKRLLDDAVAAFTRSLQIARNQYAAGTAAKSDVITAQTQLQTTQAQAIALGIQRAQFEHAIATLIGVSPAEFGIPPLQQPFPVSLPEIPGELPSALLERRPDIAAAERRMAAANASVGVAIAAYYPSLTLSGSYGFTGSKLGSLLQASNSLWSVGGQVAESVFDGGLRTAQVAQARASYDQAVANYRQTVLVGFQQVENDLSALRILAEQADAEAVAVASAQEAERLLLNQYRAGTVAYTSVVVAQTTALGNEETALNIQQSRLLASVSLITALGGSWNSGQLLNDAQLRSDASNLR